jgi:type I restriction enzyme R subunit
MEFAPPPPVVALALIVLSRERKATLSPFAPAKGKIAPDFTGGHAMLGECFDPQAELLIYEHCRPHWSQAGAVVFITFRTHDSIPREVLERWEREKQDWLRRRGKANGLKWTAILPTLSEIERNEFQQEFHRCREDFLDECHGACVLRQPALAKIVGDALLHFDGQRYRLGDFIVMPNHVHLLAVFPSAEALKEQCDS